eukprot:scaffold1272_cov250-Pinguiococcus_pyrenoidosus.AAC.19
MGIGEVETMEPSDWPRPPQTPDIRDICAVRCAPSQGIPQPRGLSSQNSRPRFFVGHKEAMT